jgi:methionyl-tRNA synthetase
VQTAPFTLVKNESNKPRVGEVLHHLLEVVRILARVLTPFMPDTALDLRQLLAIDDEGLKKPWGGGFIAGHKVNPPKVLFPRIDAETKK